jgi:hypothetical protein
VSGGCLGALIAIAIVAATVQSTVAQEQPVVAREQPPAAESVDRVRAALTRPQSKLTLKERTPDFSVHIEKRRPMQDIFDVPLWATDPVGWRPPAIGFDLLSLFRSVAKNAADAKRGHDLRLAREDVQRAIGDYCAALPGDGSRAATDAAPGDDWRARAAQICSTSPAIR